MGTHFIWVIEIWSERVLFHNSKKFNKGNCVVCNVWGSYRNSMGMQTFRQKQIQAVPEWKTFHPAFIVWNLFQRFLKHLFNPIWVSIMLYDARIHHRGQISVRGEGELKLNSPRSRCKGTGTPGITVAYMETGQQPWLTLCRRAACFYCPGHEQGLDVSPLTDQLWQAVSQLLPGHQEDIDWERDCRICPNYLSLGCANRWWTKYIC
jgi:hypothetical protein